MPIAVRLASGIVDSLKAQPLALALIVMNLLFMAFFAWIAHEIGNRNKAEREYLQSRIAELTLQCRK